MGTDPETGEPQEPLVVCQTRRRRRRLRSCSVRRPRLLRLVDEGLSDKEIAAVLAISRSTASDHVASIRAKLGVPSRAAASALAVRNGLLSS